ncbi:MAG: hypothetical protein IPI07_04110 [Flavobacteriales bacterium]|nr:hypothetical protein [Flavobacteriales bacterium]
MSAVESVVLRATCENGPWMGRVQPVLVSINGETQEDPAWPWAGILAKAWIGFVHATDMRGACAWTASIFGNNSIKSAFDIALRTISPRRWGSRSSASSAAPPTGH